MYWSSCKVPVLCVRLNCLDGFSTNTQIQPFMKIRPVGVDRRTDMTNLIVAFRNFAKAPKNVSITYDMRMKDV